MASIHCLDLLYLDQPRSIASYLLMGDDGPVLIETGPGSTFDRLTAALADHGVKLSDIRHAVVTHIHFDHAGAAGLLAQHGATIAVHEFGAKHLVDPSRLLASATRIYGDDMDRLWGRILPIPESQVQPVRDGEVLTFGDIALKAIETPGHARHHHAFSMQTDEGPVCFAGDAAAMLVPGVPATHYVSLPTPPPEFDREAWLASLERLKNEHFTAMHLTHFGKVDQVQAHLEAVGQAVIAHSDFVIERAERGDDEQTILKAYSHWVREHAFAAGVTREQEPHFISRNLLSMNVTGILRYWSKRT